jgi:hypothetical protein
MIATKGGQITSTRTSSRTQITERKVDVVVQSTEELRKLGSSGSCLMLAKSVSIAGGESICNMAWQCLPLAAMTSFSWKPIFGLNWTYSNPELGSHLTLCGAWQETRLNSVWDLRSDGYWTISDSPRVKDHIGIGNIGKLFNTFPKSSFPCDANSR